MKETESEKIPIVNIDLPEHIKPYLGNLDHARKYGIIFPDDEQFRKDLAKDLKKHSFTIRIK